MSAKPLIIVVNRYDTFTGNRGFKDCVIFNYFGPSGYTPPIKQNIMNLPIKSGDFGPKLHGGNDLFIKKSYHHRKEWISLYATNFSYK